MQSSPRHEIKELKKRDPIEFERLSERLRPLLRDERT